GTAAAMLFLASRSMPYFSRSLPLLLHRLHRLHCLHHLRPPNTAAVRLRPCPSLFYLSSRLLQKSRCPSPATISTKTLADAHTWKGDVKMQARRTNTLSWYSSSCSPHSQPSSF